MRRVPTRVVIEGWGLQARANLNGGELDKELVLREKTSKDCDMDAKEEGKRECSVPGPSYMAASGSKSIPTKQDEEKIENPPQDQPKWWRSGAINLFDPYFSLCPCLYGHLVLALILDFVASFGGSIFTFLWCDREKVFLNQCCARHYIFFSSCRARSRL